MDNIVLIGDIKDSDLDLFCGPILESDNIVRISSSEVHMGIILKTLGLIPSLGWARKNGWFKPIERGFTDFTFGKKRVRITILKER